MAAPDSGSRQALRTATGAAMTSVMAELEEVASELVAARQRLSTVTQEEKPLALTDKLVRDKVVELTTPFEGANFAERVAWMASEFEYIEVFGEYAEAHWRTAEAVGQTNFVSEWLRR
jgi:hypothetical protein